MFKSTSTPVFGILSDIVDLFGGNDNPRRTAIDEIDDRPLGYDDCYVPRRQNHIASNSCDIRVWIDQGSQSRRAYRFAVAVVDRYDLRASYRGEVNHNMSMKLGRMIAEAAMNYGLDVSQRSGNGYSYMEFQNRKRYEVLRNFDDRTGVRQRS